VKRVALTDAQARALVLGRFVRVELGGWAALPDGTRAKSAFVGRVGGTLRAYANICQHTPAELDLGEDVDEAGPDQGRGEVRRAPMADDGIHLLCHSHGALYRPTDGLCVLGPCYGQRLFPLDVEEIEGAVTIVYPPSR
jgi:nitrite reductase/ring-hydroxylating ferredoxin subunit